MKRTLDVCLGNAGVRIGVLRHELDGAREHASFAYDEAWRTTADAFPLDPTLPLVAGPQFHRQERGGSLFHLAIADTEPDGWGRTVIRRDAAKRRAAARAAGQVIPSVEGELDYLLGVDDLCRVGALRFRDEHGTFWRPSADGHRTTPPLIELTDLYAASRAVEHETETAADLAYLLGHGTSLGGLRPKCNVIDDEGRLSLAKFPSVQDTRAVTRGEVLALHLATAAGIDAAEAFLVMAADVPVTVVRRFDRAIDGARFMYVSAATMLGVEQGASGDHTYLELVDVIRRYGADAQRDCEELFRRVAFTVLINNVDDHLRNHGFLYAGHGNWRLAPAFDINPFPERARELKTWISEEAGPAANIAALLRAAPYFGLTAARAAETVRQVEAAVGTWRAVGAHVGMNDRDTEQFEEAFEHPEREIARTA
ncbi:MAG: type II toxin-antitoxin system HipA family toxin [Gemmatimonadaceae bacterium]|nr:type II toxin-antitoxin system HipA family toxin [Gemmatimonadaceae bacterium]